MSRYAEQSACSKLVLFLLAGLLMTNCAPKTAPDPDRLEARKAEAERLTRQGALAEALDQWKLLETIDSKDSEVVRMRRSTQDDMARRATKHYQRAEAAWAKGRKKEAHREYVKTLAYAPLHKGAMRRLRDMELARNRKNRPKPTTLEPYRQDATSGESRSAAAEGGSGSASSAKARAASAIVADEVAAPATPNRKGSDAGKRELLDAAIRLSAEGAYADSIPLLHAYLSDHPGNKEARVLLAKSHRQIGLVLYGNGKLRESLPHLQASLDGAKEPDATVSQALADAKSRLATQAYEKGLRVFQSDVSQAIAYWEQALVYDPDHLKARSLLSKAIRIRENLKDVSDP